MRTTLFSALVFALLTTTSVAVNAAQVSPPPTQSAAPAVVHEPRSDRVNLNTADAETLQKQLAGIGKNKADAIVAYRDANGAFTSVDELIEVKGIGKALLDKNRDKLSID
ncbi:competence protein ComEA [Pseudomonas syringae]|uniref:Competence protein ComEA n=1 Tax=Pseudomonas syringae TaxID=317 RepID=A0A244ENY7_PSESX|nr:helix-hairpin-helix domain-containing protein [Pseudomonas syringae]MCI3944607.1 helix-hairpin-helix domain-containing protein [Pseudomonas syringae]OUM06158.1 competence protein ComEA [Pseudomonas syringae]